MSFDEVILGRRRFLRLASGLLVAGPAAFACSGDAAGSTDGGLDNEDPDNGGGGPAPPDVVFFSDWRTARGNSEAAVTDGGKWNIVSNGYQESMSVISSSGLDFPSANVFLLTAVERWQGFGIVRKTGIPVPAVNQSLYYRWYFRMMQVDDLQDEQTHPIQDGNAASDTNWMFIVYNGGGSSGIPRGRWQPQFWSEGSGGNNARWYGPILNKNQTYRFELQIHRTGSSTFRMHVRIFDRAGTQIAGDADITNIGGATRLSSNPTLTFNNVNNLNGLNAGNNGIAPPAPFPFPYAYEGCFAVRRDNWCGPYTGSF
jgi:hypothetical protein